MPSGQRPANFPPPSGPPPTGPLPPLPKRAVSAHASICLPWRWLEDPRIYLFVIRLNPWRLPGASNRIVRIFDRSCPLGHIAPPGMQFEKYDAMATVALKKHDICHPHWIFKLSNACTGQSEHCTLRRRVT
ncbi:hypothetical protein E4U40_006089 [Claviceps sp. LM458 group G5]|nr:hypothetical protein E4U40_006089 [Claviceps sp. LM458 group G5]KAG6051994.1 hypothetical protein E4U39_005810 [Claviceps sp. Clav50 group G5]